MDTTAYLTGQGWLGTGHSLHPTGRGIKKPLLVSRKSNVLGVGKKKHDAHADQWWARAFDAGLKSLEVGRSNSVGATQNVKAGAWGQLDMLKAGGQTWAGNGGLYAGFVRGEGLNGTITPEVMGDEMKGSNGSDSMESGGKSLARKRRKRGVEGHMDQGDRRQRKIAKNKRKIPVAIAAVATKCMGSSTRTALVVMDATHGSEEAQAEQQETRTSVEVRGPLLDEDATGIEPVGKAGRRKKRKRMELSLQEKMSPEQSTANTGMMGTDTGRLSRIGRKVEAAKKGPEG